MFFDWKIQLEKVQFTRDLNDDTILYQGIRLPCKNDQGYFGPRTRTRATIVWFPEETCTVFQVAKIHARLIKFHQKCFIESIPYEDVNPDQIRSTNYKFRNIHKYENGFNMNTGNLIVHAMATSYSFTDENSYVSVKFQKNAGRTGGKLKPQDTESTRLQELSLMNSTLFGAIHHDIHLDMKLDYTISRIFQEMSLSELETPHQLCELERAQILQSLALAFLKVPYAGCLLSGNRSNFIDYEGNILWY